MLREETMTHMRSRSERVKEAHATYIRTELGNGERAPVAELNHHADIDWNGTRCVQSGGLAVGDELSGRAKLGAAAASTAALRAGAERERRHLELCSLRHLKVVDTSTVSVFVRNRNSARWT